MQDPTLQQVLENNYGVTEKIWAEGIFIALVGNSKSAKSLVSIGLGQRNLYIAKVVLSGPVIDFELQYLTPLTLVSLAYDSAMKMLTVKNKFKATQVYQLCTSQYEENVWDDFTSYIRYMGINKLPEVWIEQQLTAVPSGQEEVSYKEIGEILESFQVRKPSCQRITEYKVRHHGMDFVDIEFDSFVNDAQTRFSEFNGSYTAYTSWTGSAEDLASLQTEKLNVNNNASISVNKSCHNANAGEQKGFLAKLKGFFGFKKPQKSK